jgi:hypothetical protein
MTKATAAQGCCGFCVFAATDFCSVSARKKFALMASVLDTPLPPVKVSALKFARTQIASLPS